MALLGSANLCFGSHVGSRQSLLLWQAGLTNLYFVGYVVGLALGLGFMLHCTLSFLSLWS